jgi:hypothetical protein
MLSITTLGDRGTVEEFVDAAVNVGLIRKELAPKINPFLETIVAERPQIRRSMRRASLPAQVFPYFSDIDIVVDLRLAFEADTILDSVPVALVAIDTDTDGERIWFQASKQQMRELQEEIDKALKQMDAVEAWAEREPKAS